MRERYVIKGRTTTDREECMEDYEAQEVEFWAKLEEEGMSRSSMLRRSAAAAFGLTVFSSAGTALGAKPQCLPPPLKGTAAGLPALIKAAKKEGKLNTIALPRDWANYGELMDSSRRSTASGSRTTTLTAARLRRTRRSARSRATLALPTPSTSVCPSRSAGANEGLYAKYFPSKYTTIPRAMKDTRGFWMGDYWGAISIGYNQNLVSTPPKTWKDLLKPDYKGKVAINGSPLTSNSAVSGVIAAAIGNGGSLSNVAPGIDYFAALKKSGQLHPDPDNARDGGLGPDPDLDRLGLQQPGLHQGFPSARWGVTIPSDGVYGGVLRAGGQLDCAAPVRSAAVGGVRLLRPGSDPLPEGLRASGPVQRPGPAQGDPEGPADRAPVACALRQGEVREHRAADEGEGAHRGAVADQGGG